MTLRSVSHSYGPLMGQKTTLLSKETANKEWWIVDLDGKTLGRVATRIADVLRGKHRPTYTPHVNGGDFVVAINAEKIKLTGKKGDDKIYYHHTGFPGGIKGVTADEMRAKHPEDLLIKAVKGMLPRNHLAEHMLKQLKVYAGNKHPHDSQSPKPLPFKE